MAGSLQEIIAGRKTLFITPDTSIFPETFCEDYLALGFECYFIENEKRIALEAKIDIIISLFKDVILFFNIDAVIPGIDWARFIKRVNDKYHGEIPIGVMFVKRQNKDEKGMIERQFLFDIGINCGAIQLEYQKKLNYGIIEKVLYASQAMGRRKNVRALGNNGCTFGFTYEGTNYTGILQDISLSHFSFVIPEKKIPLKPYEKLIDIQINIKGLHFRSDAVFFVERPIHEEDTLYVFMFVNKQGTPGLDVTTRQLLAPRLYELMSDGCKVLLKRLYATYLDKNPLGAPNGVQVGLEDLDEVQEDGDTEQGKK